MADYHTPDDDIVTQLRKRNGTDFYSSVLEKTNWRDVQLSWKETCYIGEWSFMPDLHVEGPDALRLFSDLSVNSFEGFDVGKAKQAVMCNRDGKVIGDSVLMRVGEEKFRHQNIAPWTVYNVERGDYDVSIEVNDTFIWQVQGPNALAVMEEVVDDVELRDIPFMNVRSMEIAGADVWVVRQGMSGEIGFEIHGDREDREAVFDVIFDAGQDYGIEHLVGRTRLINHLESCFPTAGLHYLPAIYEDEMAEYRGWLADYDEGRDWTPWPTFNAGYAIEGSYEGDEPRDYYASPFELGWGRNVAFDHDFVGREALEAEADDPPRTMVTLEWSGDDVSDIFDSYLGPGEHYKYMEWPYKPVRTLVADEVLADGQRVGMSTYPGYSYYFRKVLSLCTIDTDYATPGTEVTITWGEGGDPVSPSVESHVPKEVQATVANAPYKEDRRRGDLAAADD